MKLFTQMALMGALAIMSTGCATTARIESRRVSGISNPKVEKLTVLAQATDARRHKSDQIGRHTFTIFMIPTFGVYSEEQVEKVMGNIFVETLKQSGYEVAVVNSLDEATGSVLVLQLDSIHNYLFSWLYPLGLTFGRSQMTPVLFNRDGDSLWRGTPTVGWGFCPSVVYMCGFNTSIKSEVTSVMKKIVNKELQKESFLDALNKSE